MKILVACEESQAVTIEMRKLGHEAYSCDIQPCSGGHPEWHVQEDALTILNPSVIVDGYGMEIYGINFATLDGFVHYIEGGWDMIIAHPPCTYMSAAGACRMYPRSGELSLQRLSKGWEASILFNKFLNANCEKIAVENPRPLRIIGLPPESQRIQPYEFGDPYSKLTYLWLKGLPPLKPTNVLSEHSTWIPSNTSKFSKGVGVGSRVYRNQKMRSKTFPGIAKAMAEQWAGRCGD